MVFVVLVLVHPWLLRGAAHWLVAEESRGAAQWLVVLEEGDRGLERAAQRFHAGAAERILIVQEPTKRLERLRVVPSWVEIARRKLEAAEVPSRSIAVLAAPTRDEWEWARQLQLEMASDANARVEVLCERFQGRYCRYVLEQSLSEPNLRRVLVRPLVDRRHNETNWWKSRTGFMAFWGASLDLVYAWTCGEDGPVQPEWDPVAYEQALAS